MKPKLSFEWLHACSGCEMALLNYGEPLLALLDRVEIVHFPLLMDHKYTGPEREGSPLSLPEADIGLVSGGVAHQEHLTVLLEMRRQCRTLIALGTCATHGGIPAMRNQWSTADTLQTVLVAGDTEPGPILDEPSLFLDRVYSVDEKVPVEVSLPGCPPQPELIAAIVEALLNKDTLPPAQKSVCETCPTLRKGKAQTTIRRFLDNADYDRDQPVSRMRCLLEQGLLCMGPVTAGGCGGKDTPLCLRARVPCRGCYGPVRAGGNQLLDMKNALASNGIDHRSIVDRKSLLRFSGAHGLLQPAGKRR